MRCPDDVDDGVEIGGSEQALASLLDPDVPNENGQHDVNDTYPVDGTDISGRGVTKLIQPSVLQLYLTNTCRKSHFQAAMEAGMSSVLHLWVDIHRHEHSKMKILALRGAVQWTILVLRYRPRRPWLELEPTFFPNMDACATLVDVTTLERIHFPRP